MGRHSKYTDKAGIYKLTCISNGKIYIGKSVNIRQRLNYHKNCSKDGRCHFQRAVLKYGWDSFDVQILETVDNFDKLKDNTSLLIREAYYIELFDSTNREVGYNRCKYSTDRTGIVGIPRKPHSDETREKMRQSKLGIPRSEETKQKMRQSNLGKPKSPETKEKMRQSRLEYFRRVKGLTSE